ncbi:ABC transporter permease [Nocardioides sp. HB32]
MTTTSAATTRTPITTARTTAGAGTVFGVELRKLLGQTRTRVVATVLLVAPWIFILLVLHQDRLPLETLYGRYLKTTGFATPMVVLVTATQWLFPLIAAFISGDIFSSEDNYGTYKTILTRSVSRRAVFWGKVTAALVATVGLVIAIGASALIAGLVAVGDQPFITVGNLEVPSTAHAIGMVAESWLSVLPPLIGFASIAMCVSVLTRNSVLGVVVPVVIGLVFQMYMFLNAWDTVRHALLNWPMNAWRGLLDDPSYAEPFLRGLVVSATYTAVALTIAYVVFHRRDIQEG